MIINKISCVILHFYDILPVQSLYKSYEIYQNNPFGLENYKDHKHDENTSVYKMKANQLVVVEISSPQGVDFCIL